MCILKQSKNETGIHTFLLRRKLSFAEYRQYKLILQRCVSVKREDNNDCYIKSYYFASIGYYGITAELTMKEGHAVLDLRVNPTNLLNDSYSQTEIFTRRELCKAVASKLNDALSHIGLSVDFFILSRIDLCVNVFMTPQIVETYLKLGKKSYKEYNVGKKLFEDNESNTHSLTVKCASYEVEIYDKEYEVAKREKAPLPEGSFGSILRIEARLEREYIVNHIIMPEKLHRNLNDFLEDEKDILQRIMERCFYPGTYTTLENALVILDSKDFNQKTSEIMEEIFRSKTDIGTTINTIQQKYGLSDKSIQRIRKKIYKANVNMVTLPIRDAKACGCEFLLGFSDIVGM